MDGASEIIAAALTPAPVYAAGIVFRAPDGRVLFLKRAGPGDHVGEWCGPGGKIEGDETPLEAAVREAGEEIGPTRGKPDATPLARFVSPELDFTAFVQDVKGEFAPDLNEEHTAWAWAHPSDPPQPCHPTMSKLMAMLDADELDIARMMAFDGLASPQRYKNLLLSDMRVTGTGASYRAARLADDGTEEAPEEFVWRDPSIYCNDDFLARCNGLPVIFQHPKEKMLNSKQFGARICGTVFLPYIKGEEVWAIVKLWDSGTAELVSNVQLSTSPGVLINRGAEITMEDGRALLIEGKPSLIDHLAICAQGVWDKAADPVGIRLDSAEGASVAEKTDDTKVETIEELRAKLDAANARCDSMEAELAAKNDTAAEDEPKADSEGKEDEPKADDAEEDKEEPKADEAEEDEPKKDSMDLAPIRADIDRLQRAMPKLLTDAELNELSAAQERADGVASAFGERASRPMQGETPLSYRRRLVTKFKDHSPDWKEVDLSKLDGAAFNIAERAIYADAEKVANSPALIAPGTLRERIRTDDAGRRIKEYDGEPAAWMDMFKGEPKFGKPGFINTNPDARR